MFKFVDKLLNMPQQSTIRFLTRVFAISKLIYSIFAFSIAFEQPSYLIGITFIVLMVAEFIVEIIFLVSITLWFEKKWLFLLVLLYVPNNLLFRYQIYTFITGITHDLENFTILGFGISEMIFGIILFIYSNYQINHLQPKLGLTITKYVLQLTAIYNMLFGVLMLTVFPTSPLSIELQLDPYILFLIQFIGVPVFLTPILFLWTRYRFQDTGNLLYPQTEY